MNSLRDVNSHFSMFRCQTTNSVDASNLMEIPVCAEDAETLDAIYRKDLET